MRKNPHEGNYEDLSKGRVVELSELGLGAPGFVPLRAIIMGWPFVVIEYVVDATDIYNKDKIERITIKLVGVRTDQEIQVLGDFTYEESKNGFDIIAGSLAKELFNHLP